MTTILYPLMLDDELYHIFLNRYNKFNERLFQKQPFPHRASCGNHYFHWCENSFSQPTLLLGRSMGLRACHPHDGINRVGYSTQCASARTFTWTSFAVSFLRRWLDEIVWNFCNSRSYISVARFCVVVGCCLCFRKKDFSELKSGIYSSFRISAATDFSCSKRIVVARSTACPFLACIRSKKYGNAIN